VWADEFAFQPATQSVLRTLDGGLVVFSGQLAQGRPITLEARIDQGWLTRLENKARGSKSQARDVFHAPQKAQGRAGHRRVE
jgi:hypothetical protein